jgi:Fe-S cluster assembly protein SufD
LTQVDGAEPLGVGSAAVGFNDLVQRLAGPLQLLEVLHSPVLPVRLRRESVKSGFSAQRWLIQVAAGVQLVLIDELHADAEAWHGDEVQLEIAAGASVVVLRCVDDAPSAVRQSRTCIHMAEGASLQWFGIDVRCGISRHELVVRLQGEQSSASVRGGGLLGGKCFSETRLELDHQQPGADTSTLWKMVGTDQSRGVFNGRIAIAVGADRTDAQLRTASLLLSEHAEIDVKPELEIYADEVSASHGATVGQLDERALFYLRSRGIGVDAARRMLTEAFLRDLYDAVPPGPARVLIEHALDQALPKLDELAV